MTSNDWKQLRQQFERAGLKFPGLQLYFVDIEPTQDVGRGLSPKLTLSGAIDAGNIVYPKQRECAAWMRKAMFLRSPEHIIGPGGDSVPYLKPSNEDLIAVQAFRALANDAGKRAANLLPNHDSLTDQEPFWHWVNFLVFVGKSDWLSPFIKIQSAEPGKRLLNGRLIDCNAASANAIDFIIESNQRPSPKAKGRPRLSKDEEAARMKLMELWNRAKEAGVSRKQFCEDQSVQLDYLERCINWHSKRNSRKRDI